MAEGICSIAMCEKPVFVKMRGWCANHYAKWRKYGDPEHRVYGRPVQPCRVATCDSPGTQGGGLGYCGTHYRRHQRRGDALVTSRIVGDDVARFECYLREGSVPAHSPDLGPCWLWTGLLTKDGYGVMSSDLATKSAHRWSYRHHVGELIEGMELDHLCRVRACVNPWHLDQVTHLENINRANAAAS